MRFEPRVVAGCPSRPRSRAPAPRHPQRRTGGRLRGNIAAEYVEHATALFAPQASGKVHGPTVVRETVNWLRAQFPDLQLTILAIVAGDDIVAARALPRHESRQARRRVFAPPTGRPFSPGTEPLVPGRERPATRTLGDQRRPHGDASTRRRQTWQRELSRPTMPIGARDIHSLGRPVGECCGRLRGKPRAAPAATAAAHRRLSQRSDCVLRTPRAWAR